MRGRHAEAKDTRARAPTFGIYPGSAIGTLSCRDRRTSRTGSTRHSTSSRSPGARHRPAYDTYADPGDTAADHPQTPAGYDVTSAREARSTSSSRTTHAPATSQATARPSRAHRRHGSTSPLSRSAEKPNITNNPNLDGAYPRVTEALIAAPRRKERPVAAGSGSEGRLQQHPLLGSAADSSPTSAGKGGQRLIAELDYIGLDFFPDVFRPIAPASLEAWSKASSRTPPGQPGRRRGSVTFPR